MLSKSTLYLFAMTLLIVVVAAPGTNAQEVQSSQTLVACGTCTALTEADGTGYLAAVDFYSPISGVDGAWFDVSSYQGGVFEAHADYNGIVHVFFFESIDSETHLDSYTSNDRSKFGIVPGAATQAFAYIATPMSPDDAIAYASDDSGYLEFIVLSLFDAELTIPQIPLNLVAENSIQNVTVSWSPPVSNGGVPVTSYQVYRDNSLISESAATSFVDETATPGVQHEYKVSAKNVIGEGETASVIGALTPETIAPETINNLTATPLVTKVQLYWVAAEDNFRTCEYRAYQGSTLVQTTSQLFVTFVDLAPESTSEFSISAVDCWGNEGEKTTIAVTTNAPLVLQSTATSEVAPEAPEQEAEAIEDTPEATLERLDANALGVQSVPLQFGVQDDTITATWAGVEGAVAYRLLEGTGAEVTEVNAIPDQETYSASFSVPSEPTSYGLQVLYGQDSNQLDTSDILWSIPFNAQGQFVTVCDFRSLDTNNDGLCDIVQASIAETSSQNLQEIAGQNFVQNSEGAVGEEKATSAPFALLLVGLVGFALKKRR